MIFFKVNHSVSEMIIIQFVVSQESTLFMDKHQHSQHHLLRKTFCTERLPEHMHHSPSDIFLASPHIDLDMFQLRRDLNTVQMIRFESWKVDFMVACMYIR